MKERRLGETGWPISEIGYGMWGMAGWTGSDDEESMSSMQRAVDLGCNFFDTAWGYGEGKSEALLGKLVRSNPDRKLYQDHLAAPAATIAEIFTLTRKAFLESDEELAGKVIKKAKNQGRQYEDMIRTITTSDLDTQDAVCLVLVLRFFKRVVAHMSNIASTVVMPVDMIDFYDEPES